MENLALGTIAAPLGSAILILIVTKWWKRFADIWVTIVGGFTLVASVLLIGSEPIVYRMGGWAPPWGICLVLDPLSEFMLLVVNLLGFFVTVYSLSYMEWYTNKPKFFALFLLMMAGMNGVVLTGDMFNLFVFLEIASLASYGLVGFGVEAEELEASFKYLILGSIASTLILFGVAIIYSVTGSVNMADISVFLKGTGNNAAVLLATALFFAGFATKAALVPFHAWLPDAHPSAPAPVSAMLSGVLVKALGVYAMARVFYNVIPIDPIFFKVIMVLGVISMLVGGLLATGQWDIKRMLAYSTISQIGYIFLGLSLGTALGLVGAIFHLLNHSTYKGLLFLCSGSIEKATGSRDMREFGGLSKKMPVTSIATSIGALSISGIPPFAGFWSKLIIIIACFRAGKIVPGAIAVGVAFITISYYVKLQKYTLFGKLPDKLAKVKESPFAMSSAMIILAVLCLALGLGYPLLNSSILSPAANSLLDTTGWGYITNVLGF